MSDYIPLSAADLAESKSCDRSAPVVRLGAMCDLESALESSWLDVSRATCRFLLLLREFDVRKGWESWGCSDCAEWMDFRLRITRKTALEKIRVAKAIWELPKVEAAFRGGDLSYSQVRALTRVANPENEAGLLEVARSHTAEHLEQYCRRLRHGEEAIARQQAVRDHTSRSVQLYAQSGELTVKLPPDAFALVEQALKAVVDTLPEDPTRSGEQARADALVQIFSGRSSAEDEGTSENHQVLVHVDAEALSGQGGESDMPLPTVKRLCCDGSIVPVVKEGKQILNVGRRQRTVPTAIKRALTARDRTCRFPGCHHRHYLAAHHIRHWCDGGETSLDNLILLCSHHHRLIHEGGFSMRQVGERYFFARPDGRPVEVASQL